jgi:hypothetical protein
LFVFVVVFRGSAMSRAIPALTGCPQNGKELVEAAVFETDAPNLFQRIQDAQNAIMDEIEDSFQTASPTERQSLIQRHERGARATACISEPRMEE